jgi:hypothetical protein
MFSIVEQRRSISKVRIAAPQLRTDVQVTWEYYGRQSEEFEPLIRVLGITVGDITATYAVFGALSTMHATILRRARAVAPLWSMGLIDRLFRAAKTGPVFACHGMPTVRLLPPRLWIKRPIARLTD